MWYFLTDRCEIGRAAPSRAVALTVPDVGARLRAGGIGRTHHLVDGRTRLERCGWGGGWGPYGSRQRYSRSATIVPTATQTRRSAPSTSISGTVWAVIPKTPWTSSAAYVAGRNRAATWMTGGK